LQLLAYHIADLKGCTIDQPRNLAKSVTVEWFCGFFKFLFIFLVYYKNYNVIHLYTF
jgi:hypothetical protein